MATAPTDDNFRRFPMTFAKTFFTIALSTLASMAMAGDIKPFNQGEFDQLTKAGKPVLLAVE